MLKKIFLLSILTSLSILSGCASVPMASMEEDNRMKEFKNPPKGYSGIYIYRNSNFGGALKKDIYIDGQILGESAPMTYFYTRVKAGKHTLSTESEFSPNDLSLTTQSGKNHFVRQYIKFGAFVGGAGLESVSDSVGKNGVLECNLAKPFSNKNMHAK